MPINSRQKGAQGEREFSATLFDQLGIRLQRNLTQTRNGGHDLLMPEDASGPAAESLSRVALEVKRYRAVTPALVTRWWTQAETQATQAGLWPCLAFRGDRQAWRLKLPVAALLIEWPHWQGVEWTAEVGLEAFAALAREGRIQPPQEGRG